MKNTCSKSPRTNIILLVLFVVALACSSAFLLLSPSASPTEAPTLAPPRRAAATTSTTAANRTATAGATARKNKFKKTFCDTNRCCEHWRLVPDCVCDPDTNGHLCGISSARLGQGRCGEGRCLPFIAFPTAVPLTLAHPFCHGFDMRQDARWSNTSSNSSRSNSRAAAFPLWFRCRVEYLPAPRFDPMPRESSFVLIGSQLHRVNPRIANFWRRTLWRRGNKNPNAPQQMPMPMPRPPDGSIRIACVIDRGSGLTNVQIALAGCFAMAWETGVREVLLPSTLDHRRDARELFEDVFDINALRREAAKYGIDRVFVSDPRRRNFNKTWREMPSFCERQLWHSHGESAPLGCCIADGRLVSQCFGAKLTGAATMIERQSARFAALNASAAVAHHGSTTSAYCATPMRRLLADFLRGRQHPRRRLPSTWFSTLAFTTPLAAGGEHDYLEMKHRRLRGGVPEALSVVREYLRAESATTTTNNNKEESGGVAPENPEGFVVDDLDEDFEDAGDAQRLNAALAMLVKCNKTAFPQVAAFFAEQRRSALWQPCVVSAKKKKKKKKLTLRLAGVWLVSFNEFRAGSWLPTLDWFRPSMLAFSKAHIAIERLLSAATVPHKNPTYLAVHLRYEIDATSTWRSFLRADIPLRAERLAAKLGAGAVFYSNAPFPMRTDGSGRLNVSFAAAHRPYFQGSSFFAKKAPGARPTYLESLLDRIVIEEATYALVWDPFRGFSSFSQAIFDHRCRRRHPPMRTFSYSVSDSEFVVEC